MRASKRGSTLPCRTVKVLKDSGKRTESEVDLGDTQTLFPTNKPTNKPPNFFFSRQQQKALSQAFSVQNPHDCPSDARLLRFSKPRDIVGRMIKQTTETGS